ncbi:acylphosphatase-2 [Ceratitis capitata]|nr:acylphosphatase-2 [Ceratitis capitata]
MAAYKFIRFIELFIITILFWIIPVWKAETHNFLVETIHLYKETEMSTKQIFSLDFEVFGKVQGVFFRKHTEKQAKLLGLRGWCMNTSQGTVRGQMEGALDKVNEMKFWLQSKGSPKSRIDKAVFSEMKEIPDYSFNAFTIKH